MNILSDFHAVFWHVLDRIGTWYNYKNLFSVKCGFNRIYNLSKTPIKKPKRDQ